MAYPSPYPQPYQYQYPPQVQPPMDRLAQLQAQQYQSQQYPPQVPQVIQQPQVTQSWAYVQGEAAAKSWMVANGQSVLLMDSESPIFYIKSTNSSGVPLPLRVFDYTERTQSMLQSAPQATQSEQSNLDDKYVTRKEYDALQGKYTEILERLNNFPSSDNSGDTARRTEKPSGSTRNKGGNANE